VERVAADLVVERAVAAASAAQAAEARVELDVSAAGNFSINLRGADLVATAARNRDHGV
jgi:hypothetical protein